MRIRTEQIGTFEEYAQNMFAQRLTHHVRTRYVECTVDTSAGVFRVSELSLDCLKAMVQYSMQRAKAHGITWESATAAFTALMFVVGPRFDEYPDIRCALQDPNVPDNSKVDHLCFVIPRATWGEAKQAQGPQAWSLACPTLVFVRREEQHA